MLYNIGYLLYTLFSRLIPALAHAGNNKNAV